jgi:hypothetical protein
MINKLLEKRLWKKIYSNSSSSQTLKKLKKIKIRIKEVKITVDYLLLLEETRLKKSFLFYSLLNKKN